jgi:plastocyanin
MIPMKKLAVLAIFALLLSMLAACGSSPKTPANNGTSQYMVMMGGAAFDNSSITVPKGSTITFMTDSNGSAHNLVIGTNGQPGAEDGAPDFGGTSGETIGPGKSWTSGAWNTAGTFHVTCTYHPAMNLVVTVTG